MKAKYFIIPILIVTFVTAIVAPPAHAELVTLTLVLAAAFASAVVASEVINTETDTETALKRNEPDSAEQATDDHSKLELARQ
jgi:hypothetical protein